MQRLFLILFVAVFCPVRSGLHTTPMVHPPGVATNNDGLQHAERFSWQHRRKRKGRNWDLSDPISQHQRAGRSSQPWIDSEIRQIRERHPEPRQRSEVPHIRRCNRQTV